MVILSMILASTPLTYQPGFTTAPVSLSARSPFGEGTPVSDNQLGAVSGQRGISFARKIGPALDLQGRESFATVADVSRVEMDVWWGSVGSELIANSVRAGQD